MTLWQEIDQGMTGKNTGLPNCFNRFNHYLYGIQKKTYYAIGALPSCGKTAFADDCFVLSPFFVSKKLNQKINVKWFYYSFEISKNAKLAKWLSYLLYKNYGIKTDPNVILSRGKNRIGKDLYEKAKSIYKSLEELLQYVTFVDEPQTPGAIYHDLIQYAKDNGTFDYQSYVDANGLQQSRRSGYTPHRKDEYVIPIVDHVGLTKRERGSTKKDTIDKLSSQMVYFRNLCSYSPVIISQFNRGITNVDRQKFKAADLSPSMEDFKDTGSIPEDCNVALGIFDPHYFNIKNYGGYDITQLQGNARFINLMKNRDGENLKSIGCHFIGGCGAYEELPMPNDFILGSASYQDYQ